jgi:hypothetical protein
MGKFIARQILAQKYQVGAHAIIRIAATTWILQDSGMTLNWHCCHAIMAPQLPEWETDI